MSKNKQVFLGDSTRIAEISTYVLFFIQLFYS